MTKLSNVKAVGNTFDLQRIKRGEGGNIELDLNHAKASEVHDDGIRDDHNNEDIDLTEEEQKQVDREQDRTDAVSATLRS